MSGKDNGNSNEEMLEEPNNNENHDNESDDVATGNNDVDWEAKYKSAIKESRKWERLAKSDKKKAESAASDKTDAESRAASLQKELDDLKAEKARAELISEIAKDAGVDADILARMSGDDRESIEENAEILSELAEKQNTGHSYPKVKDKGESNASKLTKEDILAIKNPTERRRAIAKNLKLFE